MSFIEYIYALNAIPNHLILLERSIPRYFRMRYHRARFYPRTFIIIKHPSFEWRPIQHLIFQLPVMDSIYLYNTIGVPK